MKLVKPVSQVDFQESRSTAVELPTVRRNATILQAGLDMVFELLVLTFFTPLGNALYIHVHTSQSHFLHARRCTGVVLAVGLCLCISGSLCHKSEAGRTTVVFFQCL